MNLIEADICIVGGGTGGWAAALALADLNRRTGSNLSFVVTEPTDWVGGQLTAQGVPSDEHPWIEEFGCTRLYREFRNRVRAFYRENRSLTSVEAEFNPGGGWVSNLCVLPWIAERVLREMGPEVPLLLGHDLIGYGGDSVVVRNSKDGSETTIRAQWFLDATEDSSLLALAGVPMVTGAEGRAETGEPHAPLEAQPDNVQAMTWVVALGWDPSRRENGWQPGPPPPRYEFWRSFRPEFWPGNLLGFMDVHPITLQPRHLPLWGDGVNLFTYRQVADPTRDLDSEYAVTIANWPMNDSFVTTHPADARELSASLVYWLQTEAPRHDGGIGYPEIFLPPDVLGTRDGFAKVPYIRECPRIRARVTVTEPMVSAEANPGYDRAPAMPMSVGVGAYRIDLHPTLGGDNYLDISSLPFQIPLGSLVPASNTNVFPAAKNIGTTHITNGCYRLHPVEWNIGEAAARLAAFCLAAEIIADQVLESDSTYRAFLEQLHDAGVETEWPPVPLRAL
jgi:hypothetical protein